MLSEPISSNSNSDLTCCVWIHASLEERAAVVKSYYNQSVIITTTNQDSMYAIFKPGRMCEGYGGHFVSEWVCASVTTLAATYLVYMFKVRWYTVSFKRYALCRLCWNILFRRYGIICLSQWLVTWLFLDKKHTDASSSHNYKWLSIWTTS